MAVFVCLIVLNIHCSTEW